MNGLGGSLALSLSIIFLNAVAPHDIDSSDEMSTTICNSTEIMIMMRLQFFKYFKFYINFLGSILHIIIEFSKEKSEMQPANKFNVNIYRR